MTEIWCIARKDTTMAGRCVSVVYCSEGHNYDREVC